MSTDNADDAKKADSAAATTTAVTNGGEEFMDYQVQDTYFRTPKRYELHVVIGKGEFGTVCRASTTIDGEPVSVAIKKVPIPSAGSNELEEMRRVVREVALLKNIIHENVIHLLDLFIAKPLITEKYRNDLYLVTEALEADLSGLLRLHKALPPSHVRWLGYQLLRGIEYLHSCGVAHRDLKPSNIVVRSDCNLKIVDFGLARGNLDGNDMTEYVVTRHYRAPELLCETKNYTSAIDIWSVACVLVEMATGQVLFPGRDVINQLLSILGIVEKPSEEQLKVMNCSNSAQAFLAKQPHKDPSQLETIQNVIKKHRSALDMEEEIGTLPKLVMSMLTFDPLARITAKEALSHPFWEEDNEVGEEQEEEQPGEPEEQEEETAPPKPLDLQIESKTLAELHQMLTDMLNSFPNNPKIDSICTA